jgi:polyhydroxybutyrate depolymerase
VPQHILSRGVLPLVLVFHGGGSSPEAIAKISAMHRIAEHEGFIVAYPAGTSHGAGLTWSPGGTKTARRTSDVGFVADMIRDLRQRYAIDSTRIFAAGFSIGGSLVYDLACRLADQIAAAAVVAGAMTIVNCDPVRPVSLIHIHGTKDRRVPAAGGRGKATAAKNKWRPVQDGIDRWCEINGCKGEPHVVRRAIEGVTGYRYFGKSDVELWLVEGAGHAWPGGVRSGAPINDKPFQAGGFSASEKIWSFFAEHARGRRSSSPLPVFERDGQEQVS